MTQETVTTEAPPSLPDLLNPTEPVTEPVEIPAAPVEGEESEAAPEGTEETTEEAPAPSWETDRERYVEDESYKREIDRMTREKKREGHIEGQKQEAGQRKQIMESLNAVHQGFNETAAILRKAVNDGYLDGDFVVRALQQYAPSWAALQGYNEKVSQAITKEGQRGGALVAIAQIANHPLVKDEKLGQQFVDKFFYDFGIDPQAATETFKEFMDEVFDRVAEKAKKPAQAQLAKADAAIEKGKLAARQNGPDTATKGGSGHKTYTTMTREERANLTDAQRDALIAQEMR